MTFLLEKVQGQCLWWGHLFCKVFGFRIEGSSFVAAKMDGLIDRDVFTILMVFEVSESSRVYCKFLLERMWTMSSAFVSMTASTRSHRVRWLDIVGGPYFVRVRNELWVWYGFETYSVHIRNFVWDKKSGNRRCNFYIREKGIALQCNSGGLVCS